LSRNARLAVNWTLNVSSVNGATTARRESEARGGAPAIVGPARLASAEPFASTTCILPERRAKTRHTERIVRPPRYAPRRLVKEEVMTAESTRIWRCPSCNRLLVEKSVDYARARHAELLARTRGGSVDFVREATWPAYLASLKRCRCGSRRELKAVPAEVVRGQLDLQIDAVVLQ